jgi:Tol biopolymer transport system component
VEALPAGRATPEDLSLRASTTARFMSSDGQVILLSDQLANPYTAYVQHADGSSPVRLGQGDAYSLSPDGRWVVAVTSDAPSRILLHPTGPGESREVPNGRHILADALGWMPDGKRLVAFGSTPTERSRGFVLDAKDGAARPFTDEGVSVPWSAPVVSPDGSRVVGQDAEGHSRLYSVDGGPSEPVPGLAGGDRVLQWAEGGRALFVGRRAGPVWRIRRLDLQTGREAPWTEITPRETAGLRLSWVYLTPNGRFWVQSYSRLLTDLYVAEGLR